MKPLTRRTRGCANLSARRWLRQTEVVILATAGLAVLGAPAHATFSGPVGKIAYTSNEAGNLDVWTMTPDGGSQNNLTADSRFSDLSPSSSPDGSKIAFVSRRDSNPEIYVMDADGSHQVRLTNNPVPDFNPSWSPDGKADPVRGRPDRQPRCLPHECGRDARPPADHEPRGRLAPKSPRTVRRSCSRAIAGERLPSGSWPRTEVVATD